MNEDIDSKFALPGRPYWQDAGVAAGCAERLLPMAASLGGRAIAAATESALALVWRTVVDPESGPGERPVIRALSDAIRNASDEGLEELGARAATVTLLALHAVQGASGENWVGVARAGALDLVGEVDFELAMPSTAVTLPDQDEIAPGPLERGEIQAQRASLKLLDTGWEPDAEALEAVQRLSRRQAAELARALPAFARRRGQRYSDFEQRRAARMAAIARQQERNRP
ncbi:MAG TPA: hypothetical protein VGC06_06220 [Actinomycetes bacterium]